MPTSFPSLTIRAHSLEPRGSFAEAQASYLKPDPATVSQLDALLESQRIGIVAHFYMDVELQGVLAACKWPHVSIADSLKMADAAVKMAEAGIQHIIVLGVDFMSENVRAVLDAAGYESIAVYRLASEEIGCSLAESAEVQAYDDWLTRAAEADPSLHVVYINTSLVTKARAHHAVPTITCTSSNVVQTILQAASQVPDLSVWYGPDTYMGNNLRAMFTRYTSLPNDTIAKLHPAHNQQTLTALLDRFHVYPQGNCVVHHMFGDDVVRRVRQEHPDAYYTAHLEVPGEMFALASEAVDSGRGAVGSTSNILGFILDTLDTAIEENRTDTLSFVLGTEAGMITAIVSGVQERLAAIQSTVAVEIIFPVASEAVTETPDLGLGILPGVAAGEGCSVAGGCATCPFMKMNDLDALFHVAQRIQANDLQAIAPYEPKKYTERIAGRTAADLGCEPILHMRHFQRTGELPLALVDHVQRS